MAKFCNNCGKELNETSKFCDSCGQETITNNPPPITDNNTAQSQEQWKINSQKYFELKELKEYQEFKCSPYGKKINSIEEYRIMQARLKKSKKTLGIFFLIILFLVLIAVIGAVVDSNKTTTTTTTTTNNNNNNNTSNVSLLKAAVGPTLTKEQEAAINAILSKAEIEVKTIKHDKALDNFGNEGSKLYRIVTKDNISDIGLYLDKNNKVESIAYDGAGIYENGKLSNSLKDLVLTEDDLYNYKNTFIQAVKKELEAPDTAIFPNNINQYMTSIQTNKDVVILSYVDSNDSSGINVRSRFRVTIKPNNTYTIEKLQ